MFNTLLIIGAFLSVFLIVVGFCQAFFNPRMAVVDRLEKATAVAGGLSEQKTTNVGLRQNLLWVLGKLGRVVPRRARLDEIQKNLIKAQIFMRADEFVGLTLVIGLAGFMIIYLPSNSVILGFFGGMIGLYLPGMLVNVKKKKRNAAMTVQLPDALGIISSGLRAGFSFPQAVSIVVREMEPPLSTEFSQILRENRIGKPMDDALNGLLERTENDDLELLVTALLIQRQVGGNLAEVLDSISHTIRERVRIKGEIKTLTAEGRMTAVILSLLPLCVAGAIALLNPGYIVTLVEEPIGLLLIGVAIILQVIGVFFIRKIVAIDV
jgi:tight adherence protein B